MANFGDLKTKVSRKLLDAQNTSVSVSEVADGINEAIKYWKQREIFWFNQLGTSLTTTIGSPILDLTGTNILYLDKSAGMVIPYQNYNYTLYQVPPDYYDWSNINSPGRPYAYTFRNGAYYLYYIPDQAYTVNLSGAKDYIDLVLDADTNDWTEKADILIVYEALSRLFQNRGDIEKADYFSQGAASEASNLRKRTSNMMASGTMRVDVPNYYTDNLFY